MAKTSTTTAFDYLSHPEKFAVQVVCAVFGDDAYLKHEVRRQIERTLLGEDDGQFALTVRAGDEAEWRDVVDALRTVSLFGGGNQLVIIDDAEQFVTKYRDKIEDYVARPSGTSCLVLELKTWKNNTRLAKAVAAKGLAIDCRIPVKAREVQQFQNQAKRWLERLARDEHQVTLQEAAVDRLCDLVPLEPGILAQEVTRLALYVGSDRSITAELVGQHVGGWRTRTAWEMIDAAADGNAAAALTQLARLIDAGEQPIGLLAQMSGVLRRFAVATQQIEFIEAQGRRPVLAQALRQAGFAPFRIHDAERQLKQISRGRAKQLGRWLLEADLSLKGHNSSPPRARIELERLIVRLARTTDRLPSPTVKNG